MHAVGKLEATAPEGHVHIRQENLDLQSRLQQNQGLGGVGCLDDLEAGVFEKI